MAYRFRKGMGQTDYAAEGQAGGGQPVEGSWAGQQLAAGINVCDGVIDAPAPSPFDRESSPNWCDPTSGTFGCSSTQPGAAPGRCDPSDWVGNLYGTTPGYAASVEASDAAPVQAVPPGPGAPAWAQASKPATVTQSSAPPSSTPAIVTQSSAPPASSGAIVTQSSAPPSGSAPPASSSSFDLSSIPWWGWLAAAGVAFLALKK
jgi:hypothetical protein